MFGHLEGDSVRSKRKRGITWGRKFTLISTAIVKHQRNFNRQKEIWKLRRRHEGNVIVSGTST